MYGRRWSFKYLGPKNWRALKVITSTLHWTGTGNINVHRVPTAVAYPARLTYVYPMPDAALLAPTSVQNIPAEHNWKETAGTPPWQQALCEAQSTHDMEHSVNLFFSFFFCFQWSIFAGERKGMKPQQRRRRRGFRTLSSLWSQYQLHSLCNIKLGGKLSMESNVTFSPQLK